MDPVKVGPYTVWFRELTLGEMETIDKTEGTLQSPGCVRPRRS